MSREVRRVPVGWKHPVEHNPYWLEQSLTPYGRSKPASRLHGPTERFVPLYGEQYTVAHQEWEAEKVKWEAGEHESLLWSLKYHSADGWVNRDGVREEPKPYQVYAEDGNTVIREFFPTSVEELLEAYPYSEYAGEPTPDAYFPDFGVPEDELGWCLYETVTEGTPVTPVFATAEELVEHLATVGQDYDQQPLRRTAAESLVRAGWAPSAMTIGGTFLEGAKDADVIEALPERRA